MFFSNSIAVAIKMFLQVRTMRHISAKGLKIQRKSKMAKFNYIKDH